MTESADRLQAAPAGRGRMVVACTVATMSDVLRVIGMFARRGHRLVEASVLERPHGGYSMRCVMDESREQLLQARMQQLVDVYDVSVETLL